MFGVSDVVEGGVVRGAHVSNLAAWWPCQSGHRCGEKGKPRRQDAPAPVVPPARFEERTAGDWWMVKSRPATVMSTVEARESTKPRFCEGRSCAKRSKVSAKPRRCGRRGARVSESDGLTCKMRASDAELDLRGIVRMRCRLAHLPQRPARGRRVSGESSAASCFGLWVVWQRAEHGHGRPDSPVWRLTSYSVTVCVSQHSQRRGSWWCSDRNPSQRGTEAGTSRQHPWRRSNFWRRGVDQRETNGDRPGLSERRTRVNRVAAARYRSNARR